jgi:hypothetical protein
MYRRKKLRNRQLRQEDREEFALGMTSLGKKYGNMIKGKAEALKSSSTSNAKQGFQKL